MKESDLLKVALVCSLIGILMILFIVQKYETPNYKINEIDKSKLDKQVGIKGQIERLTETPGLYILDLVDSSGKMTVVVFKDETLDINEGDLLEVEGIVSEYKNNVEVIAKQIKILNAN